MIGIVDYGMGNLYSVSKALERMDVDYVITDDQRLLKQAKGLILPGVGAFKDAMAILNDRGLTTFLKDCTQQRKPLLGICLGMQLLFDESEENGLSEGLGLIKGRVVRFPQNEAYKIPHMGWNKLHVHQPSSLLEGVNNGYVYFVHSYYVQAGEQSDVIASSEYAVDVPAVVGKGNVFGTQFHPEKSSDTGLRILENFAAVVEGKVLSS
ncbi:imidazole glycerol phosphate synthase subunit HisH [Cytobacillus sp. IB215665]|uniref:imidazole glycerol phosphate synthase subunit HisH n=1 Tax=Cytobacillus sp. IB215665 TaxID=3097357 RepID=UPI002A18170A|nr:imidazole glycerol phosphate synthase subunit HisH [Cytobacillus sp. IB215665]MDX8363884.1 imidazole glycerol phosphate synthase subunit HisH [Cytobacillus sp. IB215665]